MAFGAERERICRAARYRGADGAHAHPSDPPGAAAPLAEVTGALLDDGTGAELAGSEVETEADVETVGLLLCTADDCAVVGAALVAVVRGVLGVGAAELDAVRSGVNPLRAT